MLDRDWTGTAAAVTALALTAGVWLWPEHRPHETAASATAQAMDDRGTEDLARWRAEARRWDGLPDPVQLSSVATAAEAPVPVIR